MFITPWEETITWIRVLRKGKVFVFMLLILLPSGLVLFTVDIPNL